MTKSTFPRNKKLPAGISLLRQLNSRALPTTLNIGLGKPEIDMPESIRALVGPAIQESKLDYTENAGDLGTREKLAKKFSLSSGKALTFTHGAQEGLMAALLAILNTGDEVLIPDPGFLAYAPMVKMLGGKPVLYALQKKNGAYEHDLAAIGKKITSRTKAIIISSPGNPTGCDLSRDELDALLTLTERKKILILSDEVYGMLHFKTPYRPFAVLHERVISINSFSKSHALTGWRIGFIACENPELAQACLVAHQYIATCASVPSQRLLGRLLDSSLFETVADDFRKHYAQKLELFRRESSEALRVKTPTACGGFYLFPELPKKQNSLEFCEILLKKENVLAIPGSVFGKKGESSIRLSLALPDASVKKAAQVLSKFY
jgi:aspartate/methionine/tyrosine aminotransferase